MTPYTYVFVRTDLSVPQQIVQAAHVTLEAGVQFEQPAPTHMVLIGAKNEHDLIKISQYLEQREIKHVTFFEPDIDSYTAISTEPLTNLDTRKHLRKFQLLKD